ncbi:beta-N-acetylhexosaminidase [Isoptericola jiangsuensis]|uniref:beta-N-acetylhexosaminidase n=1 Tax=Isoptericola jiangsuensis TaxID=548579 RepID=A0A2A9F210_9MICO|nr:glycoside hydrolase family 3 N-terminal domain-containing protein [Isoptericola jiangsuensis]PFG44811.1 beta-N-acetylhexosaminidase [Isoptericola jiangsuensis]
MRGRRLALLAVTAAVLAACSAPSSSTGTTAAPTPSETPGTSPSSSASPSTAARGATPSGDTSPGTSEPGADVPDGWSVERKVGQLLVVGTPADADTVSDATRTALVDHQVGGVFLHGRSERGVDATRDLVRSATDLAPDGTPLLVATDQEGGFVQVLRGPGFSEIPRATEQATWQRSRLVSEATTWGAELADAGIDLNLAPVMDLVPAANQSANAPIGHFSRNYGNTLRSVVDGATAFSQGMQESGVEPVIKHFPGLGHVTENTDTTAGVVDDTVGPRSRSVEAFGAGVDAGARFVMLSHAVYTKIDPNEQATFSPAVVGLLRDDLGFDGVVMTDDVSAAAAVGDRSPGERAVDAVAAGVDLVLASADPTVVPEMADALVERAEADPEFADRVDEAVGRVLAAKAEIAG